MKEEYIAEIVRYLDSQDEIQVKCLAELSRFVDKSRLIYIITFCTKLFGI